MITVPHAKELLCRSYITAVASKAQQNVRIGSEHDYGVDGCFKKVELRGKRRHETGIALDFQAKASVDWTIDKDHVVYDLEKKAYNDLVGRAGQTRCVPFFLILFCLPRDEVTWSTFDAEQLVIKKCAYFAQPRGMVASDEKGTKRIKIPINDVLTPEALVTLLEGIKSGAVQP